MEFIAKDLHCTPSPGAFKPPKSPFKSPFKSPKSPFKSPFVRILGFIHLSS